MTTKVYRYYVNDNILLHGKRPWIALFYLFPDCTRNKTDQLSIKTMLTKNNTIVIQWSYFKESCDKGFIVYWSKSGPVTNQSSSAKVNLSSLVDYSYEIKGLGKIYLIINFITFWDNDSAGYSMEVCKW